MSANRDDFQRWIAARNQALAALDLDYVRRLFPWESDEDVLIAALHKARYSCKTLDPQARLESKRWLAAREMRGLDMLPLLPGEELPT